MTSRLDAILYHPEHVLHSVQVKIVLLEMCSIVRIQFSLDWPVRHCRCRWIQLMTALTAQEWFCDGSSWSLWSDSCSRCRFVVMRARWLIIDRCWIWLHYWSSGLHIEYTVCGGDVTDPLTETCSHTPHTGLDILKSDIGHRNGRC